ncbi:MAG: hypothetical protein QXT46_03060 [Pyrobaculum sp.]
MTRKYGVSYGFRTTVRGAITTIIALSHLGRFPPRYPTTPAASR